MTSAMTKMKTGGIVVAALLSISAVVFLFWHHSDSPRPFDTQVWKHQQDTNERLRMVDDLKPKLMGLSKAEVEQLLGAPRTDAAGLYRGYEYSYLLGTVGRLLDDDGMWLCIRFKKDRVHDVQVVRD